jgi:hypothetical protein
MRTWPNIGSGFSTVTCLTETFPGWSYTIALWLKREVSVRMLRLNGHFEVEKSKKRNITKRAA